MTEAELVQHAVNAGADLILGELDLGDRDNDLINLVVNAAVYLVENPDGSFEDMISENWGEETSADDVRGWWDW